MSDWRGLCRDCGARKGNSAKCLCQARSKYSYRYVRTKDIKRKINDTERDFLLGAIRARVKPELIYRHLKCTPDDFWRNMMR